MGSREVGTGHKQGMTTGSFQGEGVSQQSGWAEPPWIGSRMFFPCRRKQAVGHKVENLSANWATFRVHFRV